VKLEEAIQSTTFRSLKQKSGLNILYTAWWLKTLISRDLKNFGLTQEQYNVLRILKGKHPEEMCVKDIACRMIEKSSNVPRIADRLELKKLVQRSPSSVDKRETVIRLTEKGVDTLQQATLIVNKIFDRAISMSEQDSDKLNELLEAYRIKE
jgi:DNA-binding MarR family transcriptional regulator